MTAGTIIMPVAEICAPICSLSTNHKSACIRHTALRSSACMQAGVFTYRALPERPNAWHGREVLVQFLQARKYFRDPVPLQAKHSHTRVSGAQIDMVSYYSGI